MKRIKPVVLCHYEVCVGFEPLPCLPSSFEGGGGGGITPTYNLKPFFDRNDVPTPLNLWVFFTHPTY